MKHKLFCLILAAFLLLPGCGSSSAKSEDESTIKAAATTYPVYLLAQAVTDGVDGISVSLVIDQQVSCLHDYTLTMRDMEAVERADVLLINGAGLEDFLDDVLDGRNTIDCSTGISLLSSEEEHEEGQEEDSDHDHDHDHEDGHHHDQDPHIWMDPRNAAVMAQNLAEGLAQIDPDHADAYRANADAITADLTDFRQELLDRLEGKNINLITFHDGFGYFAESFGMHLLAAVEEEEGSEASAKTIVEITQLVNEHQLPAIFTEVNGSDATAKAIARECDIQIYPLSMCMSGNGGGLAAYKAVIQSNIETILEAYS